MKNSLKLLVLGIILILITAGCKSANNETVITIPEYDSDVIDWSIFSWQEDGEWVFSIVERYGGYETFEEISADEVKLPGVETLFEALLQLPENTQLVWTEHVIPGTELPPTDLLYQILDYCNSVGVPVVVLN
jgi:hypothetical protein